MEDHYDYAALIDSALRSMVREVLLRVQREGLKGDHHFYLTFFTGHAGVKLSEILKARYPDEMTIVLQHQFSNLKVNAEGFSVNLSFNNIPETLFIPFAALTAFADPSVKFGLQFHGEPLPEPEEEDNQNINPEKPANESAPTITGGGNKAEILSIDSFRKK